MSFKANNISKNGNNSIAPSTINKMNIAGDKDYGAVFTQSIGSDTFKGSFTLPNVVRLVATTNQATIGLSIIDGVALNANDLVLLIDQTDTRDSLIYKVSTAAWTRIDRRYPIGSRVFINEGLVNENKTFVLKNNSEPVVGVDGFSWQLDSALTNVSSFPDNNTAPSDPLNGQGFTFTGITNSAYVNGHQYLNTGTSATPIWKDMGANIRYEQVVVGYKNADYVVDGLDDNIQIQAAIDAAAALPNGGTVFVQAGTYQVSAPIIVKQGVSILGDGMKKTIFKAKNGLNSNIVVSEDFSLNTGINYNNYAKINNARFENFSRLP
jgi:hypothetical protein